jgi:hypothetical protein
MTRHIKHTTVLCGLAHNPALPTDLVDVLINHGDEDILVDLVDRTDLTSAQVDALTRRGSATVIALLVRHGHLAPQPHHFDDPAAAIQLIHAGQGSTELSARLAACPDRQIRRELAGSAAPMTEATLRALAEDADIPTVVAVAGWRELPEELARKLARHSDAEVRADLASNPTGTVPADVLAELAATGGDAPILTCAACRTLPPDKRRCTDHAAGIDQIRGFAMRNPATPIDALLGSVGADDPSDRAAVAERPDLPPEVLADLAGDHIGFVRSAAAGNPATPMNNLRILAGDRDILVRRAVAGNPAVPLNLLFDLAPHTRLNLRAGIPRIERATETELRGLASSRTAQVRALAASRVDLPDDLRAALAGDPDPGVAKLVADHPSVNADDLRLLAARHGPRLYSSIARNPNCPPELLHTMARNSQSVPKALREIARHAAAETRTLILCLADREARGRAAANPALPADELTALLDDANHNATYSAAASPSLPIETMRQYIAQPE